MLNFAEYIAKLPFRLVVGLWFLGHVLIGHEIWAVGVIIDWVHGKYITLEYAFCAFFWAIFSVAFIIVYGG